MTAFPFVFKSPAVSPRARGEAPSMLRASCNVHPPPVPLKVMGTLIATPFDVTVFPVVVAVMLTVMVVDVTVIPVPMVRLPLMLVLPETNVSVPVKPT